MVISYDDLVRDMGPGQDWNLDGTGTWDGTGTRQDGTGTWDGTGLGHGTFLAGLLDLDGTRTWDGTRT